MYGMKRDPSQDLDLLGLETPFAETFDAVDTLGGQAAYGETPFADGEGDFEESMEESLDWLDLEQESGEAGDDEDEAGDDEDVRSESLPGAAYDEAGDDFAFENETARPAAKSYLGGLLWTYRSRAAGTEVALYIAPTAREKTRIEVLLYVHGLIYRKVGGSWVTTCGGPASLEAGFITGPPFNLGRIIVDSGRPMALIVPRFQNGEQTWTAHGLDRPDRLNTFLAEAMTEIGRGSGNPDAALHELTIAGHSRAYGILYGIARAHASPELARGALARLANLWLLDASYNYESSPFRRKDFDELASSNSRLRISFVFRRGSGTDRFAGGSKSAALDLRPVPRSISHCAVPAKYLPVLLAGAAGAAEHEHGYSTAEFEPESFGRFDESDEEAIAAPPPATPTLKPCERQIVDMVGKSALPGLNWPDRGRAPRAYLNGMALTFARVCCKLRRGDNYAKLMARAPLPGADAIDALAHLDGDFRRAGMSNAQDGSDTLRHLFVMLVGLGMRESGGKYYTGIDVTARHDDLDEVEAGLFQMSYTLGIGNPKRVALHGFYEFLRSLPYDSYLGVFAQGIPVRGHRLNDPTDSEPGRFRNFCLTQPGLGAELAALGVRHRRKHWGPINRRNVWLSPECDKLFRDIQRLVQAEGACNCFLPAKWSPAGPPSGGAKAQHEAGTGGYAETEGRDESMWDSGHKQWAGEDEQSDEGQDERSAEWAEAEPGLEEQEEGEFGEEEAADDVTGEYGYFEEEWQPTGPEPLPVPSTAPIAFAALPPEGSFWPVRTKDAQRKVVSFPYKQKNRLLYIGRPGRTFLANRKTKKKEPRWHIGVDLFARRGDIVVACEAGTIVAFSHFYTASTGQDTFRLLIHHPASQVVVNYGEVTKDSLRRNQLKVGSEVQAGQEIGFVSDTDMIHFEAWAPAESPKAYATIPRWMKKDKKPPARLLNPTRYLLFLRENGVDP